MRPPEVNDRGRRISRRARRSAVCALLLGLTAGSHGQVPLDADWYRVEVLIFARESDEALGAEAWDPLPDLAYPTRYRFLIDAALADRRAEALGADRSALDERGLQRLQLPAPFEALDRARRPDALLATSMGDIAADLELPLPEPEPKPEQETSGPMAEGLPVGGDPTATVTGETAEPGAPAPENGIAAIEGAEATDEPDPDAPLAALPYQRLRDDQLEFRRAAAQIARSEGRVLWHAAWDAPLGDERDTLPIIIDRSGDPDTFSWPALQGSLSLHRSRYLHLAVDLWLNTDGRYLPPIWRMPAPPLAGASLQTVDRRGRATPWPDPQAAQAALEEVAEDGNEAEAPPTNDRAGNAAQGRDPEVVPPALEAPVASEPAPSTSRDPILDSVLRSLDARDGRHTADPQDASPGDVNTEIEDAIDASATPAAPAPAATEPELPDTAAATEETARLPYPYRHAIVHRQSRRMRSGEIHYLDHPVIGVVVKVTPIDAAPPAVPASERDWRLRHQLPADPLADADADAD